MSCALANHSKDYTRAARNWWRAQKKFDCFLRFYQPFFVFGDWYCRSSRLNEVSTTYNTGVSNYSKYNCILGMY